MTASGAPRPFERSVLTIPPHGKRVAAPSEWPEAFVLIERGDVELVCRGGARARFGPGEMVWLAGVGLRALLNHDDEVAVLIAISRRDDFPPARSS